MISLSDSQKSVVYAPLGNAMQVLASAGSGKTRVLTERVRYILEQTKKDCVIVLTFTNKAADEMRQRLDDTENSAMVSLGCSGTLRVVAKISPWCFLPGKPFVSILGTGPLW